MAGINADEVIRAAKTAIQRAKRHGRVEVTPDDLLIGLLWEIARFGIALIGDWTFDVEALDNAESENAVAGEDIKTFYTPATVSVFERAAAEARRDGTSIVQLTHLLVAYADEDAGLMGELKAAYNFTAMDWRVALARWDPVSGGVTNGERGGASLGRSLLSPDEAAEFLGVHTQTVRGYIRTGKLPAYRIAGERFIRIRREDLLALLEPLTPDEAQLPGEEVM